MYRIETQKNGEWQVSSTFQRSYPLDAICEAAAQLRRIVSYRVRVTRVSLEGVVLEVLDGAQ